MIKKYTMNLKIWLPFIFSLLMIKTFAQSTGINFQGIARNPSGIILASQKISLKFSIINLTENGTAEYVETRVVNTNAQGIFSIIIGDTGTTSNMGSFANINWKQSPKFLKVEMDINAGNAFVNMGTTQLQKVPFAFYANGVNANNIDGVLPISSGGTGVATIGALKSALLLDMVNNTSDVNKPISILTQNALDTKVSVADMNYALGQKVDTSNFNLKLSLKANTSEVNTALGLKASMADMNSALALKASVVDMNYSLALKANILDVATSLNTKANSTDMAIGLAGKVDKLTGKDLSTNDFTTAEKVKLAAITGTNTGDQDLSNYATIAALALKATNADVNTALALKANALDVTSALNLKANIADVNNLLNLKANSSDLTIGLSNKVNIVSGKGLSTNDYSTAEKTKLAAITGMNTGDQDLSNYATLSALNLKANSVDLIAGLSQKENSTNKSTASDLGGNSPSDILFPTQKAVKDFVTANASSVGVLDGGISTIKLADASVTYSKFQTIPTYTILGNTTSSTANVQAIATTGLEKVVLSSNPTIISPVLVTPILGDGLANSINNIALINPGSQSASLSVIGSTTIKGVNNGDNAPNQRYENILTDGIVSLNTDQPITGQKTFFNDLIMGNLGGIGSVSPTTIHFSNGSRLGDIQNINDGQPDAGGSIDLYAPDGAKWVQMNYANSNYIGLGADTAVVNIRGKTWSFNADGSTGFPYNNIVNPEGAPKMELSYFKSDPNDYNIYYKTGMRFEEEGGTMYVESTDPNYLNTWHWDFNNDGSTKMPGDLELGKSAGKPTVKGVASNLTVQYQNDYVPTYISGMNYNQHGVILSIDSTNDYFFNWKFNNDGTTQIPGSLNFIGAGNVPNPISNASIISNGPKLKIQARTSTINDLDEDGEIISGGIELSYANRHSLKIAEDGVWLGSFDADNYNSNIFSEGKDITFSIVSPNASDSKDWHFNGVDGSTFLPGNITSGTILSNQGILDTVGLKLFSPHGNSNGSGIGFKSNIGQGSTSYNGLFQLDGDGAMVFRTHQNDMYFDNFGNGNINFRVAEPMLDMFNEIMLDANGYPITNGSTISTKMKLANNGNLEVAGTVKMGDLIYSDEMGVAGDVLTYDGLGHAVWRTPSISSGGISSINGISSGTQSFTTGIDGNDFNISSNAGVHTFNIPDASSNNRGLLNSLDYDRFNNKQDAMDFATTNRGGYLRSTDFNIFNDKQDALSNPNSDLFWDIYHKRLGIRNNNPNYPFEINQGADHYGFMLNAPSSNTWGSTIGFQSNIGNGTITKTGLFQLDGDGAMVFRTYQNQMYFDNFDVNGVINFRIGGEYGSKKGLSFNNQGNLYVDGTVSAAGNVLTSDIRLKKNINPITNSVSIIQKLNPVSYEKKTSLNDKDYPINEFGFIAQEIQKVLPSLVHESLDQNKLLSLNYTAIIPILTKGIQEQQGIIEEQSRRLDKLEKLVNQLIQNKQ